MIPVQSLAQFQSLEQSSAELPAATGIAFHSARVRPGDAFFAFPGEHQHGIVYAEQALAAGAAFIVSDRPHPRGVQVQDAAGLLLQLGSYARKQLQGAVVAISGSVGKTSSKALAAAALDAVASPGNMNTTYALAQILIDAWQAGRTSQQDRLVLELGIDHKGEMAQLCKLVQPTHGLITAISPSHIKGFGSLESIAYEKTRLLAAADHALVSRDAWDLVPAEIQRKSQSYGFVGEGADVEGRLLESGALMQRLEFAEQSFVLPQAGRVMARNTIGALALAQQLGVDIAAAMKRLASVRLEPGRLEVKRLSDFTLIDDSYNSSLASSKAAFETLQQFARPYTLILGDILELGHLAEQHHKELGEASRFAHQVIAIGTEAKAILKGNPQAVHYADVESFLEVGLEALDMTGTVLVKASRGMRFERIVAALEQRSNKPAEVKT